ncbi:MULTISPECIES: hypothetical protein [Streptomyces]|uniref:Uncharacterized protein n=2 Tax=Streptomyces rimosus subsp. rimosus TaxID=132474 RepID=A0A8A1UX47_STRR1|nr:MULTISPECIES: hypothetical protein [Streptomyces]KOG70476.1 hypothetical protein ADK78_29030 [Kitasatospora aureofaciens]MYT48708.1 hypothetical protein [Streptomyces sp. SID5471]KEF06270.1 hypothetical protein DF17_15340 [Streptomyces rimosus]KEF17094.1 hypothetical protein DF18_31080 [Streptomyces rimosus]KOT31880.1 hypothetical protein ADK84_29220 [Streptomyces sp. NRRL WC-3701]
MNRAYRLAAAGVLSAALVAGTAAAASAAPAAPTAHAVAAKAPQQATLTAKASTGSVKAWQEFRISGTSTGLKAGTKVTVQQKQGAKWVSLPASVNTGKTGAYSVRVKLGIKGVNQLRIAGGGVVSPVVSVTVR